MSAYALYVTPQALREMKALPGNVRQRIKRAIAQLADNPQPSASKVLDVSNMNVGQTGDLLVCRLRIESWRILYTIDQPERAVDVLAVRKRPPYDYGDLRQLLEDTE